ncbi:DivIVA domain-containing protein [Alloiococcus sp. CFN-8]|uniref:DivIVA domain-containing protein n=1 Tax=Alloiococcus sp. CFN-8 TaxID=3416081 RepID=UPI003CEC449E
MRLTPNDIKNKEFKRGMRGYNADEVDEFLDNICEDYESCFKENALLKEKIAAANDKLDHYTKIETTIQNTLLLAQNASEQAKLSAQKEAELLLKNANESAQKIIDKAQGDVVAINDEYDKVKQEFIQFRAKYRSFMTAQLETFENLEKELIKSYNLGKTTEKIDEKIIEEDNYIVENDNIQKDELENIKSFFVNS